MSSKKASPPAPAAAEPAPPSPTVPPSPPTWAGGVELAILVVASLGSLAFYATLPIRLPSDADYEHAAAAIREGFAAGDAVANAPEWAERARQFAHGLRFIEPPNLPSADLSDVRRLWLISLPHAPRSDAAPVTEALAAKLTRDGEPQRFGELTLQRFVNPGFREPLYAFTRELAHAEVSIQGGGQRMECARNVDEHRCRGGIVQREVREIDFAPHECVGANAVGRAELVVEYPQATLGKELQVLAGITGEMGWKHSPEYTAVKLSVDIDGQRQGTLDIPAGTVPPQTLTVDTASLDAAQPHRVRFAISSDNPKEREFCFDARAY